MNESRSSFRIAEILAELAKPSDGLFRDCDWLEESFRRPGDFRKDLLRFFSTRAQAPVKSSLEAGFDFYHDLVIRHESVQTPALVFVERPKNELVAVSYAELHRACSRRCLLWRAAGVAAGDRLCIIAGMGLELLISLLCGLRLGCKISLLPPSGPAFIAQRLAGLSGAHVATPAHYVPLLPSRAWAERRLPDEPRTQAASMSPIGSHTYEPDVAPFALFSPLTASQETPIELSAQDAYCGALRDGLLLMELSPGKVFAAPEHDLLPHQPALLLSSLLQGATFLHGSTELFESRHGAEPRIHVLLANAALRDALMQKAARPIPGLELWFVHPREARQQAWQDFAARCGAHKVRAATLFIDAASGGAVLFSLRKYGGIPECVQPAPGIPFELKKFDNPSQPSRSAAGMFEVPIGQQDGLPIALYRRDSAFLYGGAIGPAPGGARYPAAEVETIVMGLPFVAAAMACPEPGEAGPVTLHVFTGPEPIELARAHSGARAAAIREQIAAKMGPHYHPTSIEQYAMFPRWRAQRLDRDWCQRQHENGTLRMREEDPLFRLLDRMRAASGQTNRPDPSPRSTNEAKDPQAKNRDAQSDADLAGHAGTQQPAGRGIQRESTAGPSEANAATAPPSSAGLQNERLMRGPTPQVQAGGPGAAGPVLTPLLGTPATHRSVVSGALLCCSFATAPAILRTGEKVAVHTMGPAFATIADTLAGANIPPFAGCVAPRPPALPLVKPCTPVCVGPWSASESPVTMQGIPLLTHDAVLVCSLGGIISITRPAPA